jgi:hypothetical protein
MTDHPTLRELLAAATITSGCDDCNSEQEVVRDGPVLHVIVHHDETCPWWQAEQARRKQ